MIRIIQILDSNQENIPYLFESSISFLTGLRYWNLSTSHLTHSFSSYLISFFKFPFPFFSSLSKILHNDFFFPFINLSSLWSSSNIHQIFIIHSFKPSPSFKPPPNHHHRHHHQSFIPHHWTTPRETLQARRETFKIICFASKCSN